MNIQYLVDEQGRRTAVVVSLADWDALQEKIRNMAELSTEEAAEFDQADRDTQNHPEKLVSIEQVMKNFGIEPGI